MRMNQTIRVIGDAGLVNLRFLNLYSMTAKAACDTYKDTNMKPYQRTTSDISLLGYAAPAVLSQANLN